MPTKINIEDVEGEVSFNTIAQGELFVAKGQLFMQTEDEIEYVGDGVNAIKIPSGEFAYFKHSDKVRKVDVEINVKFI